MNNVRNTKSCDGCIYLGSLPDAAGGGLYKCRKRPGLVVGEWGHWAVPEYDEPTHPAEWDCYEKGRQTHAREEIF
jgi:hypothetical protein